MEKIKNQFNLFTAILISGFIIILFSSCEDRNDDISTSFLNESTLTSLVKIDSISENKISYSYDPKIIQKLSDYNGRTVLIKGFPIKIAIEKNQHPNNDEGVEQILRLYSTSVAVGDILCNSTVTEWSGSINGSTIIEIKDDLVWGKPNEFVRSQASLNGLSNRWIEAVGGVQVYQGPGNYYTLSSDRLQRKLNCGSDNQRASSFSTYRYTPTDTSVDLYIFCDD